MPTRSKPRIRKSTPAKPVSLKVIAEHLGLSVATISIVINDAPAARSIPQETKDRVLKAAEELNYRPNFFARSLRRKRTFTVAVIVPEISEGYAASIMSGIEDRLLQEGYLYFVASHRGKPDLIDEYPEFLVDRGVEGFVLVNTPLTHDLPVPVVSIASETQSAKQTTIRLNNDTACKLALEHLANLGHKQIAFFKGHPGSADTELRWNGICRAASELGIEIKPELVVQLRSRHDSPEPSTPEEGYYYAQRLLESKQRFTAFFAFNDISAIGAIRAFCDAGYRVPEDISVVGFDDIQAAAFQIPRLTTIKQPLRHMGELAASTLLARIGSSDHKREVIMVEPKLVVRESTCAVTKKAALSTSASAGRRK